MNPSHADEIIQEYLRKVDAALGDVPAEQRAEIVADLRAHIDEAVGDLERATESDVRNVLERLGDPVTLAAEARERNGTDAPVVADAVPRLSKRPGALEIAAIVLTALFWPIGVVLAWGSDRWRTRDKVIATVIPALSTVVLLGTVILGMFAFTTGPTNVSHSDQVVEVQSDEQAPDGGAQPEVIPPAQDSGSGTNFSEFVRLAIVFGFFGGALAGPFISAFYLAIRLQPVEVPSAPTGSRGINGIPARESV